MSAQVILLIDRQGDINVNVDCSLSLGESQHCIDTDEMMVCMAKLTRNAL